MYLDYNLNIFNWCISQNRIYISNLTKRRKIIGLLMLFFFSHNIFTSDITLWIYSWVIIKIRFNKDVLMMSSLKLHQSKNKQSVPNFMLMIQWEICLFKRPSVIFRHLYGILWYIAKLSWLQPKKRHILLTK